MTTQAELEESHRFFVQFWKDFGFVFDRPGGVPLKQAYEYFADDYDTETFAMAVTVLVLMEFIRLDEDRIFVITRN